MQKRHRGIEEVNNSIISVNNLADQLALFIQDRDPDIDIISSNIKTTGENIIDGNEGLSQATKSARSNRKKKWMCLGIICKCFTSSYIYL